MQIIDGKAVATQIKQEIAAEVENIIANGGKRPHLAAILVGHDGGSETYVANKVKACEECGCETVIVEQDQTYEMSELEAAKISRDYLKNTFGI